MSFRHRPTAVLALVVQLAFTGAALAIEAPGPGDAELLRMAGEIPGFGGLFYDEEGRPNIYLRDPGEAGTALKALGAPQVRVHRGDFEWADLVEWKGELRPLLGLPGVSFLDVDETRNRLVVGLAGAKGLEGERVERELLFKPVPRAAVVLEEAGTVAEALTLQGRFRPAPGGVQISFPGAFGSSLCTLGFNAWLDGAFGFVTNSHCTGARGVVEGTRYFQFNASAGPIGRETVDPPFSGGFACPGGRRCRKSDSAFVRYDRERMGSLGRIARPAAPGSSTLRGNGARFTIAAETNTPLVGEVVHKVGRTTGWTSGAVVRTCVDINNAQTDFTFFCQSVAQTLAAGGDSGAPVFFRRPRNEADLVGLLWASGKDAAGNPIVVFSPLASVIEELGPLRVR